jgi:CHAT domain-containing protein/tetratricopeptide (TPR) repeat protein
MSLLGSLGASLALVVLVADAGSQSSGEFTVAMRDLRRTLDAGAFAEAERGAAEWCLEIEARFGPESLELAQALDVLVEARIRNGRGGAIETLNLAERVLRLKEAHAGARHLDTALSVHNLGIVRGHHGDFISAATLHQRALSIRLELLGSDDAVVADSRDQLAFALIQLRRFGEAADVLDESRRTRERTATDSPLALARTLELVGTLHRSSGSFPEAIVPLERALAIRRQSSPEHPDVVSTLQVRGDIHFLLGGVRDAQRTWFTALELAEKTLRVDHPVFAELLRRLGRSASALGDLSEARRLREQALRIGELSLAPCDLSITALLNGVALSRQDDGEFAAAGQLYRRAVEIIERCVVAQKSNTGTDAYATALFNQALLAQETGDFAEAERLFGRAVQVWSDGFGGTHPFVLRGRDALAEVASARGQLARARTVYERVLADRQRSLGPAHPQVAWTLTNLARTIADAGDVRLALSHIARAVTIYEKSGASDEPDHLARLLELRGTLEARQGNYSAARASFTAALSERERIFGRTHPLAAETRAALAGVSFRQGDGAAALDAALDAEQAGRNHLQFTIRYLPERQAMAYAAKRPRALDLAISVAAIDPSQAARVLDAAVRSRGVVLDEFAARARSTGIADSEFASLNTLAVAARQRFATLVVRSLRETVPISLLDEARTAKEEAERALAERSADARAEQQRAQIGVDAIRKALPAGAALVSFVRYDRTPRLTGLTPGTLPSVPAYGAFILRADEIAVTFVPLGAAASIDRVVTQWRREVRSPGSGAGATAAQRAYLTVATRLRQMVWDPLAARLEGTSKTFIVPDGLLNLVNFAALPAPNGRFLAEQDAVIHYLSTERDLVTADAPRPQLSLLALGGVAFDDSRRPPAGIATRRSGCVTFGRVRFENLPGSGQEVTEIAELWTTVGANVTHLSGPDASETTLKRSLAGQRVVHLATHGFFLGPDCVAGSSGTRAVGGVVSAARRDSPDTTENPLLLSGLALAGANRRAAAGSDQDDGILTAEEIAGLNLQGVEWAVLSACDTGLGEIRAGEGVFGLRRAFQIAGARTVIMSLWSVEDIATRRWMASLYDARLRKNLGTAESVREANIAILRDRRARGLSTHPFYWAAFIAAGDWN